MKFIELRKEDVSELKKLMQEAFQYGFESYTKQKEEQVLPEKDIDECLNNPNGHAYEMMTLFLEVLLLILILILKLTI